MKHKYSAILSTVLLFAACDPYASILSLEGSVTAGQVIHDASCATTDCHGENDGSPSTFLIDHIPHHSDRLLLDIILNGIEDEMPPQALDDQQAADILAFLRATYGEYDSHDEVEDDDED